MTELLANLRDPLFHILFLMPNLGHTLKLHKKSPQYPSYSANGKSK
jgi:hypothetical protein